jgi:hypothetical protein
MDDPLEHTFGLNGKPLRRDGKFRLTSDAQGAKIQVTSADIIDLSPSGSIDTRHISVDAFLHCGHAVQTGIGGKCAEEGCYNISCRQCFEIARCQQCLMPLCLAHFHFLEIENQRLRLCLRCKTTLQRKRRWQVVGDALISKLFRRNNPAK